eukprot:481992-Amphidinium_carterae.1
MRLLLVVIGLRIAAILGASLLLVRDVVWPALQVLGAWGCGAFGCDPSEIGGLFGKVLAHDACGPQHL